jgi:hypothetical protein
VNTPSNILASGNVPHFLLWLGDSGLATVVSGGVAFSLAATKETRGMAWRWVATFVLTTSLVFATKLGIFGWGDGIKSLDFRGPSGHATLSALVWPMVAWVLTGHADRRVRQSAFMLSGVLALGTAWVLVACDFHSVPEVVAGSLLGGGAACACVRAGRCVAPPSKPITVMAGVLIAILFGLQHGERLQPLTHFKQKVRQLVALESSAFAISS